MMTVSVCLCVCLFVRDHIFGTTHPIFAKFSVHVTCGRGSVLLWQRSDTLRTSGFMDDVMFAHTPGLLDVAAPSLGLGYERIPVADNGRTGLVLAVAA